MANSNVFIIGERCCKNASSHNLFSEINFPSSRTCLFEGGFWSSAAPELPPVCCLVQRWNGFCTKCEPFFDLLRSTKTKACPRFCPTMNFTCDACMVVKCNGPVSDSIRHAYPCDTHPSCVIALGSSEHRQLYTALKWQKAATTSTFLALWDGRRLRTASDRKGRNRSAARTSRRAPHAP